MTEPVAEGAPDRGGAGGLETDEEHFRPTGTIFLLVMFVAALILLWASVYVILISRGVTT